jgi:outer membrane immunogenic protein
MLSLGGISRGPIEGICQDAGFVLRVVRVIFLLVAATTSTNVQTKAADLLLPAAGGRVEYQYDWTGLYFGVSGGVYKTDTSLSLSAGKLSSSLSTSLSGAVGTIYSGYNWAIPRWWDRGTVVVGLEIDLSGFGGKRTESTAFGSETFNLSIASPWTTTMRFRVGIPVGPSGTFLLYGTGGVAYGRHQATASVIGLVNGTVDGASARVAWTAGAGAEWAISRYLSWKVEYLYVDTTSFTEITPTLANGIFMSVGPITENMIRTGVSWHY